jgi:hypothetical protein
MLVSRVDVRRGGTVAMGANRTPSTGQTPLWGGMKGAVVLIPPSDGYSKPRQTGSAARAALMQQCRSAVVLGRGKCAATAARSGRLVVGVKAEAVGGRPTLTSGSRHRFHQGPHALGRGGEALRIVRDLGLPHRGHGPPVRGARVGRDGKVVRVRRAVAPRFLGWWGPSSHVGCSAAPSGPLPNDFQPSWHNGLVASPQIASPGSRRQVDRRPAPRSPLIGRPLAVGRVP